MRKLLVIAPVVALAACGAPAPAQTATVSMRPGVCEVSDDLHQGHVTFAVLNQTTGTLKFALTENQNEAVASVDVAPGAVGHLDATLDGDDEYHTRCGDVAGPVITPS